MTKYVLALTREARKRGHPTFNDLVERVRGITGAEIIGNIEANSRAVSVVYYGGLIELHDKIGLAIEDYHIETEVKHKPL